MRPLCRVAVALMILAPVARAEGAQRRPSTAALSAAELARSIDRHVDEKLALAGVPASPVADDAELIRRLYLDLHGVIPPRGEVVAFLESRDADKRSRLIDRLLEDVRFGEHLADVWDAWLLAPNLNERIDTASFTAWLAESFNSLAWDELVFDLLTATGSQEENPAVVYMLKGREPLNPAEMANLASRYFMGVQLACAQCHDHPFTSYTQNDFWGIAGFFTQVEMPGQGRVRSFGITDNPAGGFHLRGYEDRELLRAPQALGQPPLQRDGTLAYRRAFAQWLTSPDNPYFARAMANRMWWHFFGRGLVDPVDDMHPDNASSHPELLAALAEQFVASRFDLKFLARAMAGSRAYQRTSRPAAGNEDDERLYSRMAVKPFTPQQLYESLAALFGSPTRPQPGATGRARMDVRVEFTEFFARDPDASPLQYENGIPQLLRLMNSPQFERRGGPPPLRGARSPFSPRPPSAAAKGELIPARGTTEEKIAALYLNALARRPTPDELAFCREHLEQGGELREVLWALLCSSEFCLNH